LTNTNQYNKLNHQLFVDLAIGAPWGGKDGKGAVFIYNVREGKLMNKPSQVSFLCTHQLFFHEQ